jgi:hypothetical protein
LVILSKGLWGPFTIFQFQLMKSANLEVSGNRKVLKIFWNTNNSNQNSISKQPNLQYLDCNILLCREMMISLAIECKQI